MQVVTCPYCSKDCQLVSGDVLYPHRPELVVLNFWRCPKPACDAYVGCHQAGNWTYVNGQRIESDGTLPLGIPANGILRMARKSVHSAFDPFWKGQNLTRSKAYTKLAQKMNRHVDTTHIAMFNIEDCAKAMCVIEALKEKAYAGQF